MTAPEGAAATLATQLLEHVLIVAHLDNLARAHGHTDVDPTCSCGAILGRVVAPALCSCSHERSNHQPPELGGCQEPLTAVRTVAEVNESGEPTGKTVDLVERSICGCPEFRGVPQSVPRRADVIAAWLRHASLPDSARGHLLLRLSGAYSPQEDQQAPTIAYCLCGEQLLADGEDPSDPARAISAWASHVEEASRG